MGIKYSNLTEETPSLSSDKLNKNEAKIKNTHINKEKGNE